MRRRVWSRMGPWVFVFTVIWYYSGNLIIKYLNDQSLSLARSEHVNVQEFSINKVSELRLRADGSEEFYPKVLFVYDGEISTLRVENDNIGVNVDVSTSAGSIELYITKAYPGLSLFRAEVTVYVPLSINLITVLGPWPVEIISENAARIDTLRIGVPNDIGNVSLGKIDIGELFLESRGVTKQDNYRFRTNLQIGKDAQIDLLNISAEDGHLDIASDKMPSKSLLDISDKVILTSDQRFFKSAEFLRAASDR